MRWTASGIGIGTATPYTALGVAGLTSDTGLTTNTLCVVRTPGAIYYGSGTLGICAGTSSIRYKNPLGDMHEGIADIMKLKPVHFTYKKGYGDDGLKVQGGFYAEDVVNVFPALTGIDKEGKPSSVDMMGIIPIMVHAIQQQQNEIAASNGAFPFHKCFFGLLVCAD
jgi:hypothetical protein